MASTQTPPRAQSSKAAQSILRGGLVAGSLDGADAVLYNGMAHGVSAARLFQFIASGVLGPRAFHGGAAAAALGVAIHFSIAMTAACAYYALSRRLAALVRSPLLSGLAFGFALFLFMHFLAVPWSAAPKQAGVGVGDLVNLVLSHVLFVGWPIALITRRYSLDG